MLVLLVLPLIYAAPISLTCAELSARFPVEGGYYRWVRLAFGDFVGYVAAWLVWLSMFATNAAFAVLFGNYLRYFMPELSAGRALPGGGGPGVGRGGPQLSGHQPGGSGLGRLHLLIFIPFLVMTVLGLWQWRFSPFVPFAHPDKTAGRRPCSTASSSRCGSTAASRSSR